jgi:hypothetical protein
VPLCLCLYLCTFSVDMCVFLWFVRIYNNVWYYYGEYSTARYGKVWRVSIYSLTFSYRYMSYHNTVVWQFALTLYHIVWVRYKRVGSFYLFYFYYLFPCDIMFHTS